VIDLLSAFFKNLPPNKAISSPEVRSRIAWELLMIAVRIAVDLLDRKSPENEVA
jgi:hypothetical protein